MLLTDKDKFDHCMLRCFQNFRSAVDDKLLDEWFDELKSFSMFSIEMAFKIYKRENEKYPPTLAAIIRLAKKTAVEEYSKLRNDQPRKCYVENCFDPDIDRCCYNPSLMVCRLHMDEMILKLDANSPRAQVIRMMRESEKERKQIGLSGLEYFKMKNPQIFNAIEKMRASEQKETARKKVVRAVQDFYDTPLSPDERKKIIAELRNVAKDGADRVKCAVNA